LELSQKSKFSHNFCEQLYADQCSNIVTKKFYVSDGRPVLDDFRLKWRMLAKNAGCPLSGSNSQS